ncbi:TRAP transporter large permease, partial [Paracoccus pacificus]
YAARSSTMPPLTWTNFAPPFSDVLPFLVLAILMVLNAPVAYCLAIGALTFFMLGAGVPVQTYVQRMIAATESFPLLAVPFFILAGVVMSEAGITGRIMRLADAMVGHMVGGLARVNVLLSTLMGGMSGSANADAAMQSTVLVPEMVSRGYDKAFSAAVTAFSAIITAIIPPSIGLILYGYLADVSIGRLFMAGLVPGLLICALQLIVVGRVSRAKGYPPSRAVPASWAERGRAFMDAVWGLLIPVGILGGIRLGWYTPTEAGAIAVCYALFIGLFVYRALPVRRIPAMFLETALATATIMLIICAAQAFGFFLSWERLPAQLADGMLALSQNPLVILLLINILLIAVGTILEGGAALIILTPLFVPVITSLGIDPVHFGVVMVLNLTIAGVTPPVGTLMYTTCSITGVSVGAFTRSAVPLFIAMLISLVLVTYVPIISLFLPNLVYGS